MPKSNDVLDISQKGPILQLRQLEYIVAISENGSLSQAARRLGIAQPALTQQIQAIEAELTVKLFKRTTRGTIPTKAGLMMIEHAYSILEKLDQARRDVLRLSNEVTGDVKMVMTSFGIADSIVPRLVKSLHLQYPKVRITVRLEPNRDAKAALANGEFDLGIIPSDDRTPNINAKEFTSQPYYLVFSGADQPPEHKGSAEEIPFREAVLHDLVVQRPHDPFRERLDAEALKQSIKLRLKIETTSLVMLHGFVEAGLAAAIIPWSAVRDKVALGRMRAQKIVDPSFDLDYLLAWPKQRPLSSAAECVLELLEGIGREH